MVAPNVMIDEVGKRTKDLQGSIVHIRTITVAPLCPMRSNNVVHLWAAKLNLAVDL